MRKTLVFVLLALSLLLAACGGKSSAPAAPSGGEGAAMKGDPAHGKELFNSATLGNGPGCATCHSLEDGVTLVGPSLAGIATEAAGDAEKAGVTPEEFLRESIVDPDADVASGFSPGVMYPNYGKELSEQDIADLIAFLMTLK